MVSSIRNRGSYGTQPYYQSDHWRRVRVCLGQARLKTLEKRVYHIFCKAFTHGEIKSRFLRIVCVSNIYCVQRARDTWLSQVSARVSRVFPHVPVLIELNNLVSVDLITRLLVSRNVKSKSGVCGTIQWAGYVIPPLLAVVDCKILLCHILTNCRTDKAVVLTVNGLVILDAFMNVFI